MSRFATTGMGDINGKGECKPVSTPAAGKQLSCHQPIDGFDNGSEKQRYQAITGSLMHLVQVTRYDILYGVNQIARSMSRLSIANTGAAKHVLRYLAGKINFDITYKKGFFTLIAFSDASWGNNLDNVKSSYPMMICRPRTTYQI